MTDSRSRRKCEIQETGLFVANPIRSAKREFVVRAFLAVPLSCILITLSFSSTFQRLSKLFFRLLCNVPKRMPREPFGPFSGQGPPLLFHRFLPLPKDSSGVLHMKRKTLKKKTAELRRLTTTKQVRTKKSNVKKVRSRFCRCISTDTLVPPVARHRLALLRDTKLD